MNYKLTVAFDGSAYSGWQFQKNAPTVQAVLTDTATRLFGREVSVTGCSRTDSGVHAENYVCNVKTDRMVPDIGVVKGMNALLPETVCVKSCEAVDEDFHARYDCVSKEYRYRILNSQIPNPFMAHRVLRFPNTLDVDKMKTDAQEVLGKRDFTSFMASGSKITDPVRTVKSVDVIREDGEIITFSICADGFLYNMVRIITGTLIDLNLGRLDKTMTEIIEARDRSRAGFTAPPDGLYLYRVDY